MKRMWAVGVSLAVALALLPAAAHSQPSLITSAPDPVAVVGLIDTGINPYSEAFRDHSSLAYKHPSTYIEGYPKNTPALKLSLGLPYEKALKKDARIWATVKPSTLYWIPGTRIVGAISMGSGGTCGSERPPPTNSVGGGCTEHLILDDHGHGTMTASRAAGSPNSLAPEARIVEVEGLGAGSVEWIAEQGWIDVQSNSWLSLVPPPVDSLVLDTSDAFKAAAEKMVTIAASGNGAAYIAGVAPTPTYLLSTAPPGVILVGGHDNGKTTLWSGAPPHVVADAYAGMTALRNDNGKMRPDSIACCTSAAAPYAAGGATAIILEARRILGDDGPGIKDGVIASGPKGLVDDGPLADGKFTLEEFKDVYFHTAEAHPAEGRDDGEINWAGDPRAPELEPYGPGDNPFCALCTTTPVEWKTIPQSDATYPFIGYGGINEFATKLAFAVLNGAEAMPERAGADALYGLDQQLRTVFFP